MTPRSAPRSGAELTSPAAVVSVTALPPSSVSVVGVPADIGRQCLVTSGTRQYGTAFGGLRFAADAGAAGPATARAATPLRTTRPVRDMAATLFDRRHACQVRLRGRTGRS